MPANNTDMVVQVLKGGLLEAKARLDMALDEVDRVKLAADIVNHGMAHPSAIMELADDLSDDSTRHKYEVALEKKIAYGDAFELIDFAPGGYYDSESGFDLNRFVRDKVI